MKILRQVLIDTIDQATADYDAQFARWNKALATWKQEQYDKWLADNTEGWRGVRDYLTKRLRDGRPVDYEEIENILGPAGRYQSSSVYGRCWRDPGAPASIKVDGEVIKPPTIIPGYSHALRKTLDAITDETVSDHQLRQIGFNNLEKLFQVAVQNGGHVGVQQ